MSDVFSLDQAGQNASNARAFANPITPEEVEHTPVGVWDGVATGVGKAIPRAFADIARAGELAASVPVGLAEPFLGYKQGELTDKYFQAIDPTVQDAVDYWTPDAASVGTAGQVLGGLTEGLVQLGVGGGNPTLMLGSTVLNRSMDLSRQGVQPDVAVAGGVVEGAATAAGFHVPILGKSLLTRMASGAAGNVAIGTAADLAQQQLLEHTGNTEAAKGYNPWSFSGAVEKALMGLAYGAIAHVQSPVTPLERDAALAALNAKHFQQDTAPGTPVDPASSVAHQEQIDQAIKQILRGDPVTPTADIMGAGFVPTPFADRAPPIESTVTRAAQREQMDHIVQVLAGAKSRGIDFETDLQNLDAEREKTAKLEEPAPVENVAPEGEPTPPTQATPIPAVPEAASPGEAQPEPGQVAPKMAAAESADPDVVAARRVLTEFPQFRAPTGEVTAEGDPVIGNAHEVLSTSDAEIAAAKEHGKAYEAAVNCALQRGLQ